MGNLGNILRGAADFSTAFFGTPAEQRAAAEREAAVQERKREFEALIAERQAATAETQRQHDLQYGEQTWTDPNTGIVHRAARNLLPEIVRNALGKGMATAQDLESGRLYRGALSSYDQPAAAPVEVPPVEVGQSIQEATPTPPGLPAPVSAAIQRQMLEAEGIPGVAAQAVASAQGVSPRGPLTSFLPPGFRIPAAEAQRAEAEHAQRTKELKAEAKTARQNQADLMAARLYHSKVPLLGHSRAMVETIDETLRATGANPDVSKLPKEPRAEQQVDPLRALTSMEDTPLDQRDPEWHRKRAALLELAKIQHPGKSPDQVEAERLRIELLRAQLDSRKESTNILAQVQAWREGRGKAPDPMKLALQRQRLMGLVRGFDNYRGSTPEEETQRQESLKQLMGDISMWTGIEKEITASIRPKTPTPTPAAVPLATGPSLFQKFWKNLTGGAAPESAPATAGRAATQLEVSEAKKQGFTSRDQAAQWFRGRGINPDLEPVP